MEEQNYQYQDVTYVQEGAISKKFFANVFLFMFVALGLSTFAAYLFGINEGLMSYLANFDPTSGRIASMKPLGYVVMFAPLGLVLTMSFALSKLSYPALLGIFIAYSVLTGISLSFIMLSYTSGSIVGCFASAAGIFGIMAFLGYTTDVDLSKFGPILMAGVIGLVVVSIINMFIGSDTLGYILGFVGIAIFTALTAYKVQEIKRIGEGLDENGNEIALADSKKLALMGALSLYITFINLFLSLLRVFGDRR